MIRPGTGDLLSADAEALVNPVNCVGVMGKGLALQFKKAWPQLFLDYQRAARSGRIRLGEMHVYATGAPVGPRYIINFPTKDHWRSRSRLQDIEAGLQDLVAVIGRLQLRSIAIPPLGAGLGGLDWQDVRPLIVAALTPLDGIDVLLWAPGAPPAPTKRPGNSAAPEMTPARAAVLELMQRYEVLDHTITHLETQKLAYFLERAGLDLDLRFKAHHYGPYSDRLYHLLQHLDGHLIHGLDDRHPHAELRIDPAAARRAADLLARTPEALAALDRVGALIEGFETPYGLELLASLHWVASHPPDPQPDFDTCVARIHTWSDRKRRLMQPLHLRLAWDRLLETGALPVIPALAAG